MADKDLPSGAGKGAATPNRPVEQKMLSDVKVKLLHMKKGLLALRQELRSRAHLWDAALEEIDQLEQMAADAKISLAKQEEDARQARKARAKARKDKKESESQDKKEDTKEEKKEENKEDPKEEKKEDDKNEKRPEDGAEAADSEKKPDA